MDLDEGMGVIDGINLEKVLGAEPKIRNGRTSEPQRVPIEFINNNPESFFVLSAHVLKLFERWMFTTRLEDLLISSQMATDMSVVTISL